LAHLSKVAIAAGALALLIVGGGAYALASSNNVTLTVCVSHNGGTLYRAKTCAKHDKRLSWNKQGPTGATGPQGKQGAQGLRGCPEVRRSLRRSSRPVRSCWERSWSPNQVRQDRRIAVKKVSSPQVVTASEASELPLPGEIQEALGELVGAAREGLLALSVGLGLTVVH
jgi:hypothetical protein